MPVAPPLGALVAAFVLVAVPVVLLMVVWAGVTAARIVFPERPLPLDGPSRRERALRRGLARPVGAREIVDDEARRHAERQGEPVGPRPAWPDGDLWLRRN